MFQAHKGGVWMCAYVLGLQLFVPHCLMVYSCYVCQMSCRRCGCFSHVLFGAFVFHTLAARVFGGCPKIKRCVSSTQGKGLDMCICFRIAIVRGALYYGGLKLMLCFMQVSPTLNGRQ